jgi:hypothetical protein
MKTFKSYLTTIQEAATPENITESLITFGGQAYPRFGHIVILAGGMASGKGFIKDNLLGIEGVSMDTDELKVLAAKSDLVRKRVQDEFGKDLSAMAKDLKNPETATELHAIIKSMNLDKRYKNKTISNIILADPSRKPNIIFDASLKSMNQMTDIAHAAQKMGYDPKNVHLVWVVNDVNVAVAQNLKRSRSAPTELLISNHKHVSMTVQDIVDMGDPLSKYMDGQIVFAFNKIGVDSAIKARMELDHSDAPKIKNGKWAGLNMYLTRADYVVIKDSGKTVKATGRLDADIRQKIQNYVPNLSNWTDTP